MISVRVFLLHTATKDLFDDFWETAAEALFFNLFLYLVLCWSQDDPKSSQQRQRYEAARHQAEQQRVAVQKQAWLKQSLARRRIEAARQHQQLLLHSRAQAFQSKVDAIRLVNLQPWI